MRFTLLRISLLAIAAYLVTALFLHYIRRELVFYNATEDTIHTAYTEEGTFVIHRHMFRSCPKGWTLEPKGFVIGIGESFHDACIYTSPGADGQGGVDYLLPHEEITVNVQMLLKVPRKQ